MPLHKASSRTGPFVESSYWEADSLLYDQTSKLVAELNQLAKRFIYALGLHSGQLQQMAMLCRLDCICSSGVVYGTDRTQ